MSGKSSNRKSIFFIDENDKKSIFSNTNKILYRGAKKSNRREILTENTIRTDALKRKKWMIPGKKDNRENEQIIIGWDYEIEQD